MTVTNDEPRRTPSTTTCGREAVWSLGRGHREQGRPSGPSSTASGSPLEPPRRVGTLERPRSSALEFQRWTNESVLSLTLELGKRTERT